MSALVTGLVWRHYPHSGARLLAMLAVADYADDDGAGVYPSAARLARKIRVETRSARRLLAALRDDGDIIPVGRTAGGVTIYCIDLGRLQEANHEDAQGTPPDIRSGGGSDDRAPLTAESGPPDPGVSHSPSSSPSINPPLRPVGCGLAWPEQLAPAQRRACERELSHCLPEHRASVVRELTARLGRRDLEPVRLPDKWVRSLAAAAVAGTLAKFSSGTPLNAEQRTSIEADYQRRLCESRATGARQLGLVDEGKSCS